MAYWIFKLSDQSIYPDRKRKYVYHNTHSVRVREGDDFVFLDKRKEYAFTAAGSIRKVETTDPSDEDRHHNPKVKDVYTAHLTDIIEFSTPLSISPKTQNGSANRARLGIDDVNLLGWSPAIAVIGEEMFDAILGLADGNDLIPEETKEDFSIPDHWGKTKKRPYMKAFSEKVKQRSNHQCVICGSRLRELMEAAHLSPYATDRKNRANPANGVCLCRFCHRAMDSQFLAIEADGHLLIVPEIMKDPVAKFHFNNIDTEQRQKWLRGVDPQFLNKSVELYKEYWKTKEEV